jgi:hypothetical protein
MNAKRLIKTATVAAPASWISYRAASDVLPWQWCLVYFAVSQLLIVALLTVAFVRVAHR